MKIVNREDFVQNRFGYCFYEIKDVALIYNLYVHPEYRRQGNANLLLFHVIFEIRATGYIGKINIHADSKEKKISREKLIIFYHNFGLVVV